MRNYTYQQAQSFRENIMDAIISGADALVDGELETILDVQFMGEDVIKCPSELTDHEKGELLACYLMGGYGYGRLHWV